MMQRNIYLFFLRWRPASTLPGIVQCGVVPWESYISLIQAILPGVNLEAFSDGELSFLHRFLKGLPRGMEASFPELLAQQRSAALQLPQPARRAYDLLLGAPNWRTLVGQWRSWQSRGDRYDEAKAFWVRLEPWQLRLDDIDGGSVLFTETRWWHVIDGRIIKRGWNTPAQVTKMHGITFQRYITTVQVEAPDDNYTSYQIMNAFRHLVVPKPFAHALSFVYAFPGEIEGREVIRVRGKPVEFHAFTRELLHLANPGADEYHFAVDVETGIVMEWESRAPGYGFFGEAFEKLVVDGEVDRALSQVEDLEEGSA